MKSLDSNRVGPPRRRRLAHFELAPGQHIGEPVRLAWVDSSEELAVRVCEAAGLDPTALSTSGSRCARR